MSASRGFLSQGCWARIEQNTFGWLPWCERKSCWWCLTSECLQSSTSYQFRCMNRISESRTSVVVRWLNLISGLHTNRECVHFLPPILLKVTIRQIKKWHFVYFIEALRPWPCPAPMATRNFRRQKFLYECSILWRLLHFFRLVLSFFQGFSE